MRRRSQNKKSLILGITGSFGSGKSTVAKIFVSTGAELIDADRIAHKVIKPGGAVYKKIVLNFGKGILGKNKDIDRKKLSRAVFDNNKLLKRLNCIVHPQVIRIIKQQIINSKSKLVILDVPLLIEAGLKNLVDKIAVVKITRKKQIERIKRKTSLKRIDILKRIRFQASQNEKLRFADFIIDNSGTITETRKQVNQIRRLLWKN
jgi:dephospho-CoA kinase